MKTFRKSLVAIAAISAFVSCQKELNAPEPTKEVHFTLNAKMPETKTGIYYDEGSYSPYWQNGDQLGVLFTLPTDSGDLTNDAVFSNTKSVGEEAAFEGTVTLSDGEGITFYSYYPATAGKKVYKDKDTDAITYGLDVLKDQSPIYNDTFGYSFDPKSDILVAKPATCTVIDNEGTNDVDMYFTRITSVLRVELNAESTVTGYGELIKSVQIETSAGDISGRVVVDLATGIYSKTNNKADSKILKATIDTDNVPTYLGYTSSNNVFFSVAPVTIPKGSTLTFTIETVNASTGLDAHKIIKTVPSTPADIVFESAKPTVLKLNIIESEVGLADTASGDNYSGSYIIANATKTRAAVKWTSGNNMGSIEITPSGDDVLYDEAITINDSKFVLTKVTTGTYTGMYTIQDVDDNYLYPASTSSNHLKATDTADENCYWTITNTDGAWSIVATKSSNRNVMQANGNIFSCYSSASQTAVVLVPWANVKVDNRPVITGSESLPLDADAVSNETLGVSFNAFVTSVSAAAYDDEGKNAVCTWFTTTVDGTDVTYSATKNDTGAPRTAYLFIVAENAEGDETELKITVNQAEEGGAVTVVDHITYSLVGVSGSNYTAWSGKKSNSDAIYAGKTAASNNTVQLNATTSNGIYTSTSGGFLKSISVTWYSTPGSGRGIKIYGSNTAYANVSTSGTEIVTLNSSTTSYTFTSDYKYISIVGVGGAVYMTDLAIEWSEQSVAGSGSGNGSYTLDSESIAAAHSSAWAYTSGEKTITAADGSVWTAVNTYAVKDQVTLQLNSGKSGYVATPVVSGKITKITVELTSAAAGTGTGTRAMNILDGSGNTVASSVAASALISGYSITGSYNQLRLDPTGATYIKSITIYYE